MATWAVHFTQEAEQEFKALPADMQAHGLRVIDLLENRYTGRALMPTAPYPACLAALALGSPAPQKQSQSQHATGHKRGNGAGRQAKAQILPAAIRTALLNLDWK